MVINQAFGMLDQLPACAWVIIAIILMILLMTGDNRNIKPSFL